MNDENDTHHIEKKVYRERKRRMKHFYNSIRQQVEFYLGDVNLSKDRFFGNLLQQSPYIEIETILKCNKIKQFTEDPKDIVKALGKSALLSVTEDGKKIFRTVPVSSVDNADECTIYVEDLPSEVDHDWLKSVFNKYGEIAYVSIPHYKTSRKPKGFAFIQFETPESADKAIRAFQSANSCLSSAMEPKDLLSVQTFEGEKDVVVRVQSEVDVDQLKCVVNNEESDPHMEDEEPTTKRRKRKNTDEHKQIKTVQSDNELASNNTDAEIVPKKKIKKTKIEEEENATGEVKSKTANTDEQEQIKTVQSDDELASNDTDAEVIPKKKIKKTKIEEEENAPEEVKSKNVESKTEEKEEEGNITEEVNSETVESKNEAEEHRSHRRKRKKTKKNDQVQTFGMQILAKNDWKKLRNKYLEEQRKRMHELKQQLRQTRFFENAEERSEMGEEEDTGAVIEKETEVSECRVKFTPGVIIKVHLEQPVKDIKHFKNEVKRFADVQYIDIDENSNLAYFRCNTNEIANQVIGLNKWPNMKILEGDDEQAYWEKIKNDRKQKFEQKIKCKTRGKNKLIKRIEAVMVKNHIRFSE